MGSFFRQQRLEKQEELFTQLISHLLPVEVRTSHQKADITKQGQILLVPASWKHAFCTHSLLLSLSQPGEENFKLSLEFCVGNVNPKFHTFQEPHHNDVNELYSG